MSEPSVRDEASSTSELYYVVRNDEDQYSIWRVNQDLPAGWYVVGEPADKARCLERIEELWTDMRPASLRRAMDGAPAS